MESVINIRIAIEKAAAIIAPLWPMQTIIARNPLEGMESLNFEEAIAIGERFFCGNKASFKGFSEVNRQMIKWCQAYLDDGQATLTMPEREKGFYFAWSLLAPFDRELRSSAGNPWLKSLPSNAEEAIILCLKKLAVSDEEMENYFKEMLSELPGWAGYIKWRSDWQNKELGVKNPITLTDFLAVRLMITCAISGNKELKEESPCSKVIDNNFLKRLKSREENYLKTILKSLLEEVRKFNKNHEVLLRPDAQIVFCIDVRSEPLRKRIEQQGNYETFGFAGFFGLPVSIYSHGKDKTKDCCPVLIKPKYKVYEEFINEGRGRGFLKLCQRLYQDLKYNFATPFALVETLGLWSGFWMGLRTLLPVSSFKLKQAFQSKLKPRLKTTLRIDIPLANQVDIAESAFRVMGLTKNFGRLVVLCGHGSQTVNNPYASALDCGACGGNSGGLNGKILAEILNSREVREVLHKRGIAIPADTLFIGAEHNTTTDEMILDDLSVIDQTRKDIFEKLKTDLKKAGNENRQDRCKTFGLNLSLSAAKGHVLKRSSNWSEVRPEWGLARNAAFIVGPRNLTKDLDLDGRCFLHSYAWEQDNEGKFLEAILTAPMIVAEWINTQYFFSTLNNVVYGSGSKVTQNVTGKFGVMQGNGSDLMQGLPLQSVNKADDLPYHEVMRLQVIVYAPRSRLDLIIEKHAILQNLFFKHWVNLVVIDPLDNKPYCLVEKDLWFEVVTNGELTEEKKQSVNLANLQKEVTVQTYSHKTCALATMHDKEKAIAPSFLELLGLNMVKVNIDTDQLGTFTGEVERKGTPLACARRKCELGMKESRSARGLASEGSFGPHPFVPLVACDHEIIYFEDQERGFSIHQSLLSLKTNYRKEALSDLKQLKKFCDQAFFPSHALIIRPNQLHQNSCIVKGIRASDLLEETFLKCCRMSDDGRALVETDMRAHMNPTRMGVIKELADSLAKRLATLCPACSNPGWGVVDIQKGLECELCGSETEMIKAEILGCPKCLHRDTRPRPDGLVRGKPQYCGWCNP